MPIPAAVGYVTMGIVAGLLALLHQGANFRKWIACKVFHYAYGISVREHNVTRYFATT